jgi:hypothetical protein
MVGVNVIIAVPLLLCVVMGGWGRDVVMNAMNSNLTDANVTNATNATTVSIGSMTSASLLSAPSLGYDSAVTTTSAPSASSGSSSAGVPASAKGVKTMVNSTSGESDYDLHDKNDGDSRTGLIVGIFAGILVPCLVGIVLLYRRRSRRSSRMDLNDAESHHIEIGPRRAEAMAKKKNEAYHPNRRDKQWRRRFGGVNRGGRSG